MDYDSLAALRRHHPGWRLLAAEHGPLVAAFLDHAFLQPNQRTVAEAELANQLDDFLAHARAQLGEDALPKPARQYLNDWAGDERAWLRKYYPEGQDEAHYDLAPATEKALQWLASLGGQHFVGAESRLLTVFELLREMTEGAETDPRARIEALTRRKQALEVEIDAIEHGRIQPMDATRLRERFLLMADTARGLLADFRQVEQNFRDLDRQLREQAAAWEGGKGAMLEEVFGASDAITESDQGRSFRAFWDFLMSPARQEEFSTLLGEAMALDPIQALKPDPRLAHVHYDWLDAGEVTLRTVARLSEQLRRYLDDQAWLENRRIMQLAHAIEQHALALRDAAKEPPGRLLDAMAPELTLPLERPLYRPPVKPHIEATELARGSAEIDPEVLFDQFHVDRDALRATLRHALAARPQASLKTLLEEHPLKQGLAELVTWLALAAEDPDGIIDDATPQEICWHDADGRLRRAMIPQVIFSRPAPAHA